MTTLMVKIHRKTGLQYFCKTTRSNVMKYPGSGKYWKRHLKKHGDDINTIVIAQFDEITQKNELEQYALEFSRLQDIVESKEWANLKPENGLDGGSTPETNGMKGKKHSEESKKRMSESQKGLGLGITFSNEVNKSKGRIGEDNGFFGKTHSEETINKQKESRENHPTWRNNITNKTEDWCENISKALMGKKKSKEHCNNISKALKNNPNLRKPKPKTPCEYCGRLIGNHAIKRHENICKGTK